MLTVLIVLVSVAAAAALGLLLPFIALQMYFHPLIWIASLWAATFPGWTWSLPLLFRRGGEAEA